MQDFTNANANDFTQKDLMLHLLQVSQHTVTREEVKEDISKLDKKIDRLEESMLKKFEQVDKKFEQVDKRFDKLEYKIEKVDAKFDKLTWLIIATLMSVFFKDYIFSILHISQ